MERRELAELILLLIKRESSTLNASLIDGTSVIGVEHEESCRTFFVSVEDS